MPRNEGCRACTLGSLAKQVCVWGTGASHAPLLVVGQNPGREEDRSGLPFVGPSGQLLRKVLSAVGLETHVRLTNAIRCHTPSNRPPTTKEGEACRPYLLDEIRETRPTLILALGAIAARELCGRSGVKSVPTPLRATMRATLQKEGIEPPEVVGAIHPAAALRMPSNMRYLEEGIAATARLLAERRGETTLADVGWSEDPAVLDPAAPLWTFDIESTGTNYRHGDFRIHMLGVDDGRHICVAHDRDMIDVLQAMMIGRMDGGLRNAGFNSTAFDAPALARLIGPPDAPTPDDVMYLVYLADEEAPSKGLQAAAVRFLGVPPWKDDVTWEWSQYDREQHGETAMRYNARDVRYTHRLDTVLRERLTPGQLAVYQHIMLPAGRIFERIHRTGAYVDQQALDEEVLAAEVEIERHREVLVQFAEEFDLPNFNPNSFRQVGRLLFDGMGMTPVRRTESGAPSTDEDTLQALRLQHESPVLESLLSYREWSKHRSELLPYRELCEADRRVHPRYSLVSTTTGRTSAQDPGIQRFKRGRVRRVIAAPPGRVLIAGDLSQIELRVAAWLADEKRMLEVFTRGGDPHALMAQSIVRMRHGIRDQGITVDFTKEERTLAKSANFGALYGAEAYTLQAYILKSFGIRVSMREATVLRQLFFDTWPDLVPWYYRVLREMRETKQVVSPLGRIRHLANIDASDDSLRAEALRQGINAPVQATGSDLLLAGMICLDRDAPWIDIVAEIHDALLCEVDERDADRAAIILQSCLEERSVEYIRERFGVEVPVPIVADVKVLSVWE